MAHVQFTPLHLSLNTTSALISGRLCLSLPHVTGDEFKVMFFLAFRDGAFRDGVFMGDRAPSTLYTICQGTGLTRSVARAALSELYRIHAVEFGIAGSRRVYRIRSERAPKQRPHNLSNYAYSDESQVRQNNARARRYGVAGRLTVSQWRWIKMAQQGVCLACKQQAGKDGGQLTVDHVQPLSKGGDNTPGNIQGLCLNCNTRKGVKHIDWRESVVR